MLKEGLLEDIKLSDREKQAYYESYELLGKKVEPFAFSFMRKHEDFRKALSKLYDACEDTNKYTLDLMFVLLCTGYLYEDYKSKNISDKIFINSMYDIKYKIAECRKVKKVFGTFVIEWYEGFLKMQRFAFGRLQFDVWEKHKKQVDLGSYTVKPNQFSLNCHIPSGKPLDYGEVIASYKEAFEYFKSKITDGVLPIFCESWLLYPRFREIFNQNCPNISKFISDFEVYEAHDTEKFYDAWRIFDIDYEGNTAELPKETCLQKAFSLYLENNTGFGEGEGVALFDGEKIRR